MKKIISPVVLTLLISLLLPSFSPEVKAETSCGTTTPQVTLSEFSFNNTVNDFVELTVIDDGNHGLGQILDNYAITSIDANVKKIPTMTVKTGDRLKFDDIPNLTATTDQLVLTHNNEYIDAVCWASATPTDQEKSDFAKLTESKNWNGTIETCLSSINLEKNTSFKRKPNADTNSATDWEILSPTSATPITTNPVQPTTESTVSSNSPVATNEIMINEFLPDPEGSDDGNEWIELKNTSDHAVSLLGWQIDDEDGGSKPYALGDITVGAESFLLLKNDKTNITLNNSIDAVRLLDPSGSEYEKIPYTKIASNQSWARTTSNQWKLTKTLTPGEENIQSDEITDPSQLAPIEQGTQNTTIETVDPTVIISEILPNPTGTDNGNEWIEINNKTVNPVSLGGWRITNGTGKTFVFSSSTIIPANGYIILTDQETKITLKNSADQIEILDPMGQIQNSISYEDAPENTSFAEIATIPLPEETKPQISFMNWLIPTAHAQSSNSAEQIIDDDRETSWEWTQMITKGEPNPTFLKINGVVTHEPDSTNTFTIKTSKEELLISFDPKKTDREILTSALKLGATLQIKAIKRSDGTFVLENYTMQNKQPLQDGTSNTLNYKALVIAGLLLLGAATITAKTYLKKTESIDHHDLTASEGVDIQPHISLT
ncbi:MAG: lamin tail domain-containing protein [Candidatus Peregrinibacteria bacterium]|nr:lamin tail domain-containing protein [Candidatus Peregrinibacteria bacterium]